VDELQVHLLRGQARVDQGKDALQGRALAEVVAHRRVELDARGLRDLGVAVARQVDEAPVVIDGEKIDQLRLARQVGDQREVLFFREQVDQRGLADV
jgi:hypothetical protein